MGACDDNERPHALDALCRPLGGQSPVKTPLLSSLDTRGQLRAMGEQRRPLRTQHSPPRIRVSQSLNITPSELTPDPTGSEKRVTDSYRREQVRRSHLGSYQAPVISILLPSKRRPVPRVGRINSHESATSPSLSFKPGPSNRVEAVSIFPFVIGYFYPRVTDGYFEHTCDRASCGFQERVKRSLVEPGVLSM